MDALVLSLQQLHVIQESMKIFQKHGEEVNSEPFLTKYFIDMSS